MTRVPAGAGKNPSLRRRLLASMLLPAAVLAVVLGAGGALLIHNVVETTHDRVLDGSVLAIAERLAVDEDDEVTVDLPPVALGMLESQAGDQIYYSVSYGGAPVTGYHDLPLADTSRMMPWMTEHRDSKMRGAVVRVAAQARPIYGKLGLVLVQVAETRKLRSTLEWHLLGGLVVLEAVLLVLVGALAWLGIGRGLEPLTQVSAEIDHRAVRGAISLRPLHTLRVPEEALAPVLAFNAMLERLEQMMGAMRRFTADASHQMRTPLTVLRMHLALLRRMDASLPERRAVLDDLESATRRLERLLEQLIGLARADELAVDTGPQTASADLAIITAEVLAEHVPHALACGMEIIFERPDGPVPILGHPLFAGEMIGNLLDNAICYNRAGGTITVRVAYGEAGARAEIEDEGPGISQDERAKVFERFYRASQTKGLEGSGLGLAIVRALADRLGAAVTLSDRVGGSGLLATVLFRAAGLNQGPVGGSPDIARPLSS